IPAPLPTPDPAARISLPTSGPLSPLGERAGVRAPPPTSGPSPAAGQGGGEGPTGEALAVVLRQHRVRLIVLHDHGGPTLPRRSRRLRPRTPPAWRGATRAVVLLQRFERTTRRQLPLRGLRVLHARVVHRR